MGMNFTSWIVGIIVVSMVFIGFGSFMGDLGRNYGVEVNQSQFETFNKLDEIINTTAEIHGEVIGEETSTGDVSDNLITQGLSAIKFAMTGGIGLVRAMLLDASNWLGIPSWFVSGILAIIIIILSLVALTILTRAFKNL